MKNRLVAKMERAAMDSVFFITKKASRTSSRTALRASVQASASKLLAESKLTVVDGWTLNSNKTKPFRAALTKLEAAKTVLLVDVHASGNRNLELASRNLAGVKLVTSSALQTYDLLRHDRLIASKDAALKLSSALSGGK